MNYKTLILISSVYLISGCSSKDSNPKDYWELGEPKILAWDTSGAEDFARVSPINKPLSEFKSSDIQNALGFESHLLWINLNPKVKFEIKTVCQTKDVPGSDILQKTSTLEKSNKIYFHNYLPDQVLIDEVYTNNSLDYLCNFNIIATNEINSKHSFDIKSIKINTLKQNFLDIYSITTDGTDVLRTINVNPTIINTDFPSLNFSNKELDYTFKMKNTEFEFKKPSFIKCIGENNKFELLNQFDDVRTIKDAFISVSNDNSTAFLKKCRVLAFIDKNQEYSSDQMNQANQNRRLVWSDYFDVIFETPKLELQTHATFDLKSYPLNQGIYLEPKVHIFDLEFTNKSDKKMRVHLPDYQKFEALLKPILLITQRPISKPNDSKDYEMFKMMLANDEFLSEISFSLNSAPVYDFILDPKESKKIAITLSKNFKCQFPKSNQFFQPPHAEVGFRIQSIDINSDQNKIKIDYLNQGQLEEFPENFNLNSLIQNITNNIYSGTKGEKVVQVNHLQGFPNRTHVIDVAFTLYLADQNVNYSSLFLEGLYSSKDIMTPGFIGAYLESDFEGYFCEQVN